MTPISVPVAMAESLPDMSSIQLPARDSHSPLLPVRKRKRKQQSSADTESIKWAVAEGVGASGDGIVIEARPIDHVVGINSHPVIQETVDITLKDEIMEDHQSCNGEPGKKILFLNFFLS